MKERPIIFSPPMVRAILRKDLPKTQTRRVMNIDETGKFTGFYPNKQSIRVRGGSWVGLDDTGLIWRPFAGSGIVKATAKEWSTWCPYGGLGDRLWVKEGWRPYICHSCALTSCDCGDVIVKYVADGTEKYFEDGEIPDKWTMPKAAAKHAVTCLFMPRWASRILLEIVDIRVEKLNDISDEDAKREGFGPRSARALFKGYWDTLNIKRCPWSANPWVWLVEFQRVQS